MNPDEYKAALERAKHKDSLEHGEQGSEWKNHKYIRKIGNRYIYAEDLSADFLPLCVSVRMAARQPFS